MNLLNRIFLLGLFASLLLASCNQDDEMFLTEVEPEEITPTEQHANGLMSRTNGSGEGIELECLLIEYPFDLLLSDTSTATVGSENDFIALFDNPDVFPVDFVYPLEVFDADENEVTVNNAEELAELFADCVPGSGWGDPGNGELFFPAWAISYDNSCYQLVYPLEVFDLEGNFTEVEDEGELVDLLATGDLYSFTFPLELEDADGNTVIAEDDTELIGLLNDCNPSGGPGGTGIGTFGCYKIGYPLTLTFFNGSTTEVNDDDEFMQAIMSGEWIGFEFPLTLIDEDGNEVIVNSEVGLFEALSDCGFDTGGPFPPVEAIGCYFFNFPIQVPDENGNAVTINSAEEYSEFINTVGYFGFVYPLSLTHVSTGEEITVNSEEELNEALEECNNSGGGGTDPGDQGEFFCYDFSYPFDITDPNGNLVTIDNYDEFLNTTSNQAVDFVYPITLLPVEGGDPVVVNGEAELGQALSNCW